uniref:Nucleophosmin n=1 Tax=Leptobrachium leishanense TaxID=445787 RepID=A0A8C5PV50_9ANUR
MEDSMDMDNVSPLRPQNFLFGCELKSDKREYSFKVDDDENEHQLSLRTVSVGATAKDEFHVVEAEGMNYEGKMIKISLASLKPSVQPTVSLGGFEITPPVTLRLKSGSGPVFVSGQHLVALEEDLESSDEEEESSPSPKNAKRPGAINASKVPQKKAKVAEEDDDDDDDDDDEDDEDFEDEDEEETPVKPIKSTKSVSTPKSNHNGKASERSAKSPKQCPLSTHTVTGVNQVHFINGAGPDTSKDCPNTSLFRKGKIFIVSSHKCSHRIESLRTPDQKGKSENKQVTPRTPKTPLTFEEMQGKIQSSLEKGVVLPKLEAKFVNYVKNSFRTDNQKIIQDLWKWRLALKDAK